MSESKNNPFLGLRTVINKVSDLDKAKEWYTVAFGEAPYFDEPFYVGFNIAGYELGLIPEKSKSEKSENVMTYWGVTDIEEKYKFLLSVGAMAFEAPHNVGGEIVVAAVKDPWQNIIGIIYNPYFKSE